MAGASALGARVQNLFDAVAKETIASLAEEAELEARAASNAAANAESEKLENTRLDYKENARVCDFLRCVSEQPLIFRAVAAQSVNLWLDLLIENVTDDLAGCESLEAVAAQQAQYDETKEGEEAATAAFEKAVSVCSHLVEW